MKFENNWLNKTMEALEKGYWKDPGKTTYLIETCHKLRKKQLKDFETKDLRIMIGQNLGLKYIIPIAIKKLNIDILADGDFFESDLLLNILRSDSGYWKEEKDNWNIVYKMIVDKKEWLAQELLKTIRTEIFEAFEKFERIN